MPYDESKQTDQQRATGGRDEFFGPKGLRAGVSHLRVRDEWSAWTYDPARVPGYDHEVFPSRAAALDSLRVRAPWASLPDA